MRSTMRNSAQSFGGGPCAYGEHVSTPPNSTRWTAGYAVLSAKAFPPFRARAALVLDLALSPRQSRQTHSQSIPWPIPIPIPVPVPVPIPISSLDLNANLARSRFWCPLLLFSPRATCLHPFGLSARVTQPNGRAARETGTTGWRAPTARPWWWTRRKTASCAGPRSARWKLTRPAPSPASSRRCELGWIVLSGFSPLVDRPARLLLPHPRGKKVRERGCKVHSLFARSCWFRRDWC